MLCQFGGQVKMGILDGKVRFTGKASASARSRLHFP